MAKWIKQANKSTKSSFPCVSVRRLGLGLSSGFVEIAGVDKLGFAEIFVSECGEELGIKFLKEKTDHCYLVTQDGGTKERQRIGEYKSRFIACGNVIRNNPGLNGLLDGKGSKKIPVIKSDDLWVAKISPSFCYSISSRGIRDDELGVYRYLVGDEVVYIGRGNIKTRIASIDRKDWVFDDIEYMLTTDDEAYRIEATLLENHKAEFGSLPVYNKVMGFRK